MTMNKLSYLITPSPCRNPCRTDTYLIFSQWRSQDFLKEGSYFHGAPRYPHQNRQQQRNRKNSSDLAHYFLEGAQFDEQKKNEKEAKSFRGPHPRGPTPYPAPHWGIFITRPYWGGGGGLCCALLCQTPALTEITKVREGVCQAVDKREHAGQLVEVDVLVQGQDRAEAVRASERDDVTQHDGDDERTGEVERLACGAEQRRAQWKPAGQSNQWPKP